MHQGDIRRQETHGLDLSHKACPLQPLIEQGLVERSDLAPAFEVCAIEPDEVAILGEGSGKGLRGCESIVI